METNKTSKQKAEEFIGKKLEDFTIDDMATIVKSDELKEITVDIIFLLELLSKNKDVEIQAVYHPIVILYMVEQAITKVSSPVQKAASDLELDPANIDKEYIDTNISGDANVALTGMLLELTEIANQRLTKNNFYEILGAIIQLSSLTDFDLKSKKNIVTEALALAYADADSINLVTGANVTVLIFNAFVDPIERLYVHKYNESIVNEDDVHYQSVVKNMSTLLEGLEYERENESTKIVS